MKKHPNCLLAILLLDVGCGSAVVQEKVTI